MPTGEPSFAIPPTVLYQPVGREMVLLNLESEQYFALNEVGAHIVTHLTEKPLEEAFATLEREYEVDPDVLRRDVVELIDGLLGAGLLVRVGTSD